MEIFETLRNRIVGRTAELGAETVEVVLGIALVTGVGAGLYGLSGAMADTAASAGSGISAAFNGMGDGGAASGGSASMGDLGGGGSGGSGSGSGGGLTPGQGGGAGSGDLGGDGQAECAEGNHDWGEWRQVKAVTCEQDGSRVRYCLRCGEAQPETVASEGHDYTEEVVTEGRAATCTEEGVSDKVRRHCSRCGDTTVSGGEVTRALGHDFSVTTGIQWDAKSPQSATCTFSCSRCGRSETVRATVTASVRAAATCTEMGTTSYSARAVSSTGEEATDAKDVVDVAIDPGNHDYSGEDSTDSNGVSFTHYVCSRDASHQYWRNNATGKESATKDGAGWVDHSFSATTYAWSGSGVEASGWKCTASRYCTVHRKVEGTCEGTIGYASNTAATCIAIGSATLKVTAFPESWADPASAGTKSATTPALGHDYVRTGNTSSDGYWATTGSCGCGSYTTDNKGDPVPVTCWCRSSCNCGSSYWVGWTDYEERCSRCSSTKWV